MVKNKYPNVLILLATCNGEQWIEEQLNSILSQLKVNIFLLVRDNFSSDSTVLILKKYCEKFNNIKIIKTVTKSNNAGSSFIDLIINSKIDNYDFVAFADQDDIWFNYKLDMAISKIKIKNYSGYSSSVVSLWSNGKMKVIAQSNKLRKFDFLFEGAGQGCTFVFPNNVFNEIRQFCLKNKKLLDKFDLHDWLTYILIRTWKLNWFFDKHPSMYYRQHKVNIIGSRGTFISIFKRFRLIQNGWYKNQINNAINIYLTALNYKDNEVHDLKKIINKNDSIRKRYVLARFFLLNGRRKFFDRIVMVLSSFLGFF